MAKAAATDDELQELHAWCLTVVRFMARLSPSEVLSETESIVDTAFKRRNARGLRTMAKDLREWTKALSHSDRNSLDEELRLTGNATLEPTVEASDEETVLRVLERGTIVADDEYRILLGRAEAIHDDGSKANERRRINSLLAAYHSRER